MTRLELLEAARNHIMADQTGLALFSILVLVDHDLVRIAKALERRNQMDERGGVR